MSVITAVIVTEAIVWSFVYRLVRARQGASTDSAWRTIDRNIALVTANAVMILVNIAVLALIALGRALRP